jgi:hypothetical protein
MNRTGDSVDQLRGDIVETREDLGDTVQALAGKADVKHRAKQAAEQTAEQVGESVRRRPGRWGAAMAAVLAGATAIGVVRWRRKQRTPRGRAERAWRSMTDRWDAMTSRFSR